MSSMFAAKVRSREPSARAWWGLALRVCLLVGLTLWVFWAWGDWVASFERAQGLDPQVPAARAMRLLRWVSAGFTLLVAAWMISWTLRGVRTLQSGEYPPPAMAVLRKTPVREGGVARAIAIAYLAVALGGGFGVIGWVWSAGQDVAHELVVSSQRQSGQYRGGKAWPRVTTPPTRP